MKSTLLATVALSIFSANLFAANEPWKKSMSCGYYKSVTSNGVTFDASRYSMAVGPALNEAGTARDLVIYQNEATGSFELTTGKNCRSDGSYLTCQVGTMKIVVSLSQNPVYMTADGYETYTYAAKVTVPGTVYGIITHTGKCVTDI